MTRNGNSDVALALSGGGYRAAHFHLGVLRKLHELELLERVEVMSSVSGGSILASLYVASRLRDESFAEFERAALDLMHRRVPLHLALLFDFVPFTSSGERIAKTLTKYLSRGGRPISLDDLAGVRPRLVLNTTNIRTGAGVRFKSGGTCDHWEIGTAMDQPSRQRYYTYRCRSVSLAQAVTASAAFPAFSAMKIPAGQIERPAIGGSPEDEFSRYLAHPIDADLEVPLLLSDGGVRDNTGVTSVMAGLAELEEVPYVIVSDAGVEAAPITTAPGDGSSARTFLERLTRIDRRGRVRKLSYLKRSFDMRGRHNNQMTSLLALTDYLSRERRRGIAMFRIDRATEDSDEARLEAARLHAVRTGLRKLGDDVEQRLQQHGATLLWSRLSRYTDLLADAQRMPGVERKVEEPEPVFAQVLS